MSPPKRSQKTRTAAKKSESNLPKTLSSFWWKLSVSERNKHLHVIKVYLLSPVLFMPDEYPNKMLFGIAVGTGIVVSNESETDEGMEKVLALEAAMSILEENLSKFDESSWLLESMMRWFEDTVTDTKFEFKNRAWLTHLRKKTANLEAAKTIETLCDSVRYACKYIQQIHAGVYTLETYKDLSELMEPGIIEEKHRGNLFYKEERYEQAIEVYSRIIQYKLALVDAKRTIVLDPSYEKVCGLN
eukprot:gene11170-12344_t